MTAFEARKIATSINSQINTKELKEIEDNIAVAANGGNLSTYFYESISTPVSDELRRRGFQLSTTYDARDGVTILIKW